MKGVMYFDGASKNNPGKAGIGVVIEREDGIKEEISKFIGIATNNQAEYSALIEGLKKAQKLGIKKLIVKGDSQLVIKQMKGEYKVKNPDLKILYLKAKQLEKKFESVSYEWIRRKENKRADYLANLKIK